MQKPIHRAALIGLVGVTVFLAQTLQAETLVKEFGSEKIKEIEIQSTAGDIWVENSASGRIEVEARSAQSFSADCRFETGEKNGKLRLSLNGKPVRKRRSFLYVQTDSCSQVRLLVRAPGRLPVSARTYSGNIEISGRSGPLNLETSSGDITGKDLSSALKAELKSGDAFLLWKRTPAKGEISVKTASGDIQLGLPAGSELETDLRGSFGSLPVNEIGNKPGAALKLAASSHSGSVAVKVTR